MTDYLSNVIGRHTDLYHNVIRMLGVLFCQEGESMSSPLGPQQGFDTIGR